MADEERSRREVRILPAVIAAGVAVAIAVGVVAYAAGHYGEQTKTLTIQAAGGPGAATRREGVPAGGRRRAHLRPVRLRPVPRLPGARRSRSGRAGAEDGRPEPHGRPAHAHHQPRPRRVGGSEAAVHAGLGRGHLEDAGLRTSSPTSGPACRRSRRHSRSRSRRDREPRSPAPRSTSATAASTATARTASAACRTRSRRTRLSRRCRARASATTSRRQAIAAVIRSGSVIGKAPIVSMPHWGGILSDQQIAELNAYLKTLK